jgi:undecaprenyl-diphosphatase
MPPLIGKLRGFFAGKEPLVFVAALLVVLGVWGFSEIYDEVREGDTQQLDSAILKAFRQPGNTDQLRGPHWVQPVVQDVTALGGVVVLLLVVSSVAGFLLLSRRYHMMWMILAATLGAIVLNTTIKNLVDRPRPTVVKQLMEEQTHSFPSGHSAMSAAVYLTLGGLLAQTVSQRRLKLYFVSVALLLTLMIGVSRVALGVHYPTDVLAGWTTGLVWALLCWLVGRYLQRRGAIEKEEDPTAAADPSADASSI